MTTEQILAQLSAKPKATKQSRTNYDEARFNGVTYSSREEAIEEASMQYVLADLKRSGINVVDITEEVFDKLVTDKIKVIENSQVARTAGEDLIAKRRAKRLGGE